MEIAICDDEEYMIKDLSELLKRYFQAKETEDRLYRIDCYQDGEGLLQGNKQYDIIFLDIRMKGLNGLETARALRGKGFAGFLVFITALEEFVFDSFTVEASDYLLKPLDEKRFWQTMDRIGDHLQKKQDQILVVQRGNECHMVRFDEIVYCEAMNRKISLHLITNEVIDYYFKLENLERKLDGGFYRCHRSYLVHLKYVRGYEQGFALMYNGEQVPVSRLRSQEFSQTILHYMKDKVR